MAIPKENPRKESKSIPPKVSRRYIDSPHYRQWDGEKLNLLERSNLFKGQVKLILEGTSRGDTSFIPKPTFNVDNTRKRLIGQEELDWIIEEINRNNGTFSITYQSAAVLYNLDVNSNARLTPRWLLEQIRGDIRDVAPVKVTYRDYDERFVFRRKW